MPPYITYPEEIPNFDRFSKQLIDLSAILTPLFAIILFLIKNRRGSIAAGPFEQPALRARLHPEKARPRTQPQRHPNSQNTSSPLWMAMRQQWLIFNGGL